MLVNMKSMLSSCTALLVSVLVACGGGGKGNDGGEAGVGLDSIAADFSADSGGDTGVDAGLDVSVDVTVDSGNNLVWTDTYRGLMWEKEQTGGEMYESDAATYCKKLALDGRVDWRVPTISELRTLINGCTWTVSSGSCGVTDSCLDSNKCMTGGCGGCPFNKGPANGCYWPSELKGKCDFNWSSSVLAENKTFTWTVRFLNGSVGYSRSKAHVRCVRSIQ